MNLETALAPELEPSTVPTIVRAAAVDGMDTCLMQIECGFTRGFAGMQLIGNLTEVCRDGKERARAALERLGIHIPPQRLVVSVTPADIKKDGNQFDLPFAVSLALLLKGQAPRIDPSRWLFAAELGLGGELRPVRGVVSFAVAAMAAGLEGLVIAQENAVEVGVLRELNHGSDKPLRTMAFPTLKAVLAWLLEQEPDCVSMAFAPPARDPTSYVNFDDMLLHPTLEIVAMTAAAGKHSLILRGSPGTGKSMFAARLPSILPPLERDEQIDAMRIYSASCARLPESLISGRPPYRAPHHQASSAAVLGSSEAPGELALAHGGVLFLDELPEFRRDLLESLREPLETGEVRVSRSRRKLTWKARVLLVAACNNCPCGWSGSTRQECRCSQGRLIAYRQRLSGPILDRIDLHVNVPEPSEESAALFIRLAADRPESISARMLRRVEAARAFSSRRNARFGLAWNRDLAAHQLVAASGLSAEVFANMVNRFVPRSASSRSVIRGLRVARTLADLDESPTVRPADLEQAWSWRAESAAAERGELLPGTVLR